VVQLNDEATNVKRLENINDDTEKISIRDHKAVGSSDIKITLIELSKAALVHLRVISSVNLGDAVTS
jgi:hypothetical protein